MYNRKPLLGVGINDSDTITTKDGVRCNVYMKWKSIINRVYSKKALVKKPQYEDVQVCPEWLYFTKFKSWFLDQRGWDNKDFQIDKDLLSGELKIYSPETCVLVPKEINFFLIGSDKCVGSYLKGVTFHKNTLKFKSQISVNGVKKTLGTFTDEYSAHLAFKEAKEAEAKRLAEKWKGKIDERAYDALINWNI